MSPFCKVRAIGNLDVEMSAPVVAPLAADVIRASPVMLSWDVVAMMSLAALLRSSLPLPMLSMLLPVAVVGVQTGRVALV